MIVQDDSFKPHRMHFKSPSFAHIQLLKKILVGHRIADVTAILGSLDFIMGCCDR
jgi:NADH-quinone oxidoreductase subunit D